MSRDELNKAFDNLLKIDHKRILDGLESLSNLVLEESKEAVKQGRFTEQEIIELHDLIHKLNYEQLGVLFCHLYNLH